MSRYILLTTLLVASLPIPIAQGQASPETSVEARTEYYVDDDDTWVLRPMALGQVLVNDTIWGASATVDVVSSASIDIVTTASQRIEARRYEFSVNGALTGEDAFATGGALTYAFEEDYSSVGGSVFVQRDLDDARLWHGRWSVNARRDLVGTVLDPRFEERAHTLHTALALSRILSPRAVVRANIELGATFGFQSSAYRNVRLGPWEGRPYTGDDPDTGAWVFSGVTGVVRERHPNERIRGKLTIDGAHDIAHGWAAYARLSAYSDSWQMHTGAFLLEARWEPEDWLFLRLGGRLYKQSPAYFFRRRYLHAEETNGYITGDREMGPLQSASLLLAAEARLGSLTFDVSLDLTRYSTPEFDLREQLNAMAMQVGVKWSH